MTMTPKLRVALIAFALSFSLDVEVEGMLPWRRAGIEAKIRADGIDPDTE